jgi:hypothetical protein
VLTSTLTVTTTGVNHASGGTPVSLGFLPGLLLLGFAAMRKRIRKGMLPLAILLVLAAVTGAVTGCGTGPSSSITPVGVNTVTVTATLLPAVRPQHRRRSQRSH